MDPFTISLLLQGGGLLGNALGAAFQKDPRQQYWDAYQQMWNQAFSPYAVSQGVGGMYNMLRGMPSTIQAQRQFISSAQNLPLTTPYAYGPSGIAQRLQGLRSGALSNMMGNLYAGLGNQAVDMYYRSRMGAMQGAGQVPQGSNNWSQMLGAVGGGLGNMGLLYGMRATAPAQMGAGRATGYGFGPTGFQGVYNPNMNQPLATNFNDLLGPSNSPSYYNMLMRPNYYGGRP